MRVWYYNIISFIIEIILYTNIICILLYDVIPYDHHFQWMHQLHACSTLVREQHVIISCIILAASLLTSHNHHLSRFYRSSNDGKIVMARPSEYACKSTWLWYEEFSAFYQNTHLVHIAPFSAFYRNTQSRKVWTQLYTHFSAWLVLLDKVNMLGRYGAKKYV
jgi:hypothetical protein